MPSIGVVQEILEKHKTIEDVSTSVNLEALVKKLELIHDEKHSDFVIRSFVWPKNQASKTCITDYS